MRIPRAARSRRAVTLVLGVAGWLLASAGPAWAAGGQISGTVTDASSQAGVGNVEVDVYDSSRNFVTSTLTVGNGSYGVSGLATGSYEVGFAPTMGNYLPQFYRGQTSLAVATPVGVTTGGTTSGIDAALAPGGQISGTVSDASGAVNGAEVDVYDAAQNFVTSTVTASSGTYTLSGLATGSYEVGFVPPSNTDAPAFYNGKASLAAANPVTVTAGATTTGIDATLPAGGQITGKVIDAASPGGVGNVEVDVYDAGHNFVTSTVTASSGPPVGTYTVSGLFPGNYEVGFLPTSGTDAAQFYNGLSSLASATVIPVGAGSMVPGIDADLAAGGQISGVLTSTSSPTGVGNVTVNVFDSSGGLVTSTVTGRDGTYTVFGLVPASYRLGFVPRATYAPQFYLGQATLAAADPVTLTAGSAVSGIDASLAPPTLTVGVAGAGSGAVTGSGINCPGTCSQTYAAGTAVTLTANAAAGSTFAGWSGGGCGAVPSCTVTLGSSLALTADFAAPPSNRTAPGVTGNATTGRRLTANSGTWSGTAPLAYSYQWQRCSPTCVNIAGATGTSHRLVVGETGARILIVVTAANTAGRTSAHSAAVGPVGPSLAQIKASLSTGLVPKGKSARIGAIVKAGGYRFSVKAPSAGREQISWYLVAAGAQLSKGLAHKPLLVATGRFHDTKAGSGKLMVTLTAAGKKALKHAKRITLSAKATFAPPGRSAVSVIHRFRLRR